MQSFSSEFAKVNFSAITELAAQQPIVIRVDDCTPVVMMNPRLACLALEALEDSQDAELAIAACERVRRGGATLPIAEVVAALALDLSV